MPTTTRAFLVIGFGLLLGASSIWSALRGPRPLTFSSAGSSLATRLGTGVRLARLVLGLSLVGLALFLLAGRTTWSTTAPGWATPVGAALLALCLVSVVVVGAAALTARLRTPLRSSRRALRHPLFAVRPTGVTHVVAAQ